MAPGFGQGPSSSSSFSGPPSVMGGSVFHEHAPELGTATPSHVPSTPAITDGGCMLSFVRNTSFNPQCTEQGILIILIFLMQKLRLREVKQPVRGHSAGKCQSWDLNQRSGHLGA